MTRLLVVGAGRVGAAIVRDLAAEPGLDVTAADRSEAALEALAEEGIATEALDLGEPGRLEELASRAELVVGAVPGAVGHRTVARLVEAGSDVVDISFFPEDPFTLDTGARERGVRVLVDCGVAPGLSNLLLGHALETLDRVDGFRCLVGGLPSEPVGPWRYRAPFSPRDVVEEYVRPARFRRDGRDRVASALDELELLELPGVGEVEAFLTDGLRTLLETVEVPDMVEKTVRWPGHAERVRALRDSGFFGVDPVRVGEASIRPLDLTSRLLEAAWQPEPGEEELTVMRVEITGEEAGRRVREVVDLLDRTDPETGTSSMARTTGYTCTAIVRWLLNGGWDRTGVAPPETLGRQPGCLDFVEARLAERGVRLTRRRELG